MSMATTGQGNPVTSDSSSMYAVLARWAPFMAMSIYPALLYRKLIVRRLARSRSIDAMVGAAIYAACRLRRAPRSLEEIARHSRVSKKKIGQHYRLLVEKLKLRMPISDPANYVPRFITQLGLPGEVQKKVLEILEQAKKNRSLVTGRDPRGLAAAAIYIASILTDHRVTQRDIAMAAGVTEVTVRNRYKELVEHVGIRGAKGTVLDYVLIGSWPEVLKRYGVKASLVYGGGG